MAPLVFDLRRCYVHTFAHKGSESAEIQTFSVSFLNPLHRSVLQPHQSQNEMNNTDDVIHLLTINQNLAMLTPDPG